ncbi:MAG: helix-turn-helix domain-containing protein [Legionellales bacterium]|jgi:putative transcriptional regulator
MNKKDFDQLLTSIRQAGAIRKGRAAPARQFLDVSQIRSEIGLSQMEFAQLIHISLPTLRNWEQKRRAPSGPALSLLTIIKNRPKEAIEALNEG